MAKWKVLDPHGIQKSFYGKAKYCKAESIPYAWLMSYNTIVCGINFDTGTISRHWDGTIDGRRVSGKTTFRHVRAFFMELNMQVPSFSDWDETPVCSLRSATVPLRLLYGKANVPECILDLSK